MLNHQITQLNTSSNIIDFGIGQPDLALLPLSLMAQAADHRLKQKDTALLQYGAVSGPSPFRLALAQFLTQGYGQPVQAESLFITNGASQALDLICSIFTQAGDTIFVEEASYFLALDIFKDHNLNIVSIAIDEDGLNINDLEEKLSQHHPVFLYTIPTFHNPTAVTLTESRRQALVNLSVTHNFLIVADEVYQLLNYTTTPPPPLAAHIDTETVLSVGTFSKILAPGLRLGWIQAAPSILKRFIQRSFIQSGGGLNPFTAAIVQSLIEQGWQEQHLTHLKTTYKQRAAILSTALQTHLPNFVHFTPPQGGFFIWLSLPKNINTTTLLKTAHQHNVGFQAGIKFSSTNSLQNYIRLSFCYYNEDKLQKGVKRLAKALNVEHEM